MTTPKPGDRVRVTYEGEWSSPGTNQNGWPTGYVGGCYISLGPASRLEILPPPEPVLTFCGFPITDDAIIAVANRVKQLKQLGRL